MGKTKKSARKPNIEEKVNEEVVPQNEQKTEDQAVIEEKTNEGEQEVKSKKKKKEKKSEPETKNDEAPSEEAPATETTEDNDVKAESHKAKRKRAKLESTGQTADAAEPEKKKRKKFTIIINNISETTTEETLRNAFSKFGELLGATVMKDKEGGLKGFAFVDFKEKASRLQAIEEMDGTELDGATISVKRKSGKQKNTIFISNLSPKVDEEKLKEMFSDCGSIVSVRIPHRLDGTSKGMGFVDFVDDTSIKTAIEKWDGKKVEGMELKIFMDSGSNAPLSLMITNLSLATKEETLKKVFEECGAVKSVFITSNKSEPGTAKAFVDFKDPVSAQNAYEKFDKHNIDGKEITVVPKPPNQSAGKAFQKTNKNWAPSRNELRQGIKKPQKSNEVCLGCRQPGHMLKDCPEKQLQGKSNVCFNCGKSGHRLRDCPAPKNAGGTKYATCFVCNEKGHLASACPKSDRGVYPKGGGCRVCGSNQHLAKDCPEKAKRQQGGQYGGGGDYGKKRKLGADEDDAHAEMRPAKRNFNNNRGGFDKKRGGKQVVMK